MIHYTDGTVFNTDAKAIVNTINCTGVMNAGIALEYSLRYPEMFADYEEKCKNKLLKVGNVDYYQDKDITIVNFPTKWHFKYPSQLPWIESGLQDFVKTYKQHNITSIAFPKLGTLNGKLSWRDVRALMEKYLGDLPIDVYICLDNNKFAEGIEKQMLEYFNNTNTSQLTQYFRLSTKQIEILDKYKPYKRFWHILDTEGIGTTVYKNIFKHCYSKINNTQEEQICLF
jgi:O-acetyl-ADP-ribose deacetylase (regulator of RNase III)